MAKAAILIVEDNYIVMMELKDRLIELDYDVVGTAPSGLEAIEKAERLRPDLTLMDIRLKGDMDGIDTATIIKKEFDIPVVYLTAHTDEDTLQRAKVTEPFGYIIKPFEERELHTTIEMALYKHKMGERLKESEHWLSATLKSIGDALIATDAKGIIKIINPIAEEITGWQFTDAIGKEITKIFIVKDEEEKEYIENPVVVSLRKKSIVGAANKTLESKDGRCIPVDFSAAPIKDEKNLIAGVVLVFRDISERKKAKELLEKQKVFLRQIIDTDPNYISVKNLSGRYELINKATAIAYGTTTEDMTGKIDEEYLSPEEIQYHRKLDVEVIRSSEDIFIPEEKLVDSKGKIHLLQTFKRAIQNIDGNGKLVLSVASDITNLKLAENALRESEGRIKTLLRAIPDAVLRYQKDGVILDYHIPEPDSLFTGKEIIIGEKLDTVLKREVTGRIFDFSERAIETKEVQVFELENKLDEQIFYKEVRIVNIPEQPDNNIEEFIVIIRDITERKKALMETEKYLEEVKENKNILEQKASELSDLNKKLNKSEQELKELNASKDKFFSIIAHDLKSPFTSLLGLSQYLASDIDKMQKDEINSVSRNLLKSVELTYELLENLLYWSRVRMGKIKIEREKFALYRVIYRMMDLYAGNAENKKIKLEADVDHDINVFADMNMVETIIRNLISNSIKFTGKNGRINIYAEAEKDFVKVKIKDNGIGIKKEQIEKIFKIDENISTLGTLNEKGSGLGLILCKEFVELNNGKISVESEAGKGTTVSFTLPYKFYN